MLLLCLEITSFYVNNYISEKSLILTLVNVHVGVNALVLVLVDHCVEMK